MSGSKAGLNNARGLDRYRGRFGRRFGPWQVRPALRGPHQTALAALNTFDRFLFLDSSALSLGEIVIMAAQNGLYVFLKVFAELAYLFLYAFFRFRLRTHQIFTCLSGKPLREAENDRPGRSRARINLAYYTLPSKSSSKYCLQSGCL